MNKIFVLGGVLLIIGLCYGQNIGLPEGFNSYIWASGLSTPRQMCTFRNGDVIVVQNAGNLLLLTDDARTGRATSRTVLASAPSLQSNIACHNGFIYAQNYSSVLRWSYNENTRVISSNYTVVVTGFETQGHANHPITFDPDGRIYVSLGSNANLDLNSRRARIIRSFNPLSTYTTLPLVWPADTQVFADGTRNEAGLRFNSLSELWGVENERDNLFRSDLGGDIHNTNPSEEINRFPDYRGNGSVPIGQFYGYPYCFTEYRLNASGLGVGTQWADPHFINDSIHTDAWCRDRKNVQPPAFALPAHNAPLDINFYETALNPAISGSWTDYLGSAFVALHGSWNRNPPSGYAVWNIRFNRDRSVERGTPFFFDADGSEKSSDWRFRPAGVAFTRCGAVDCLLIASDASNEIIAVARSQSSPSSSSAASRSTAASASSAASRSNAASVTSAASRSNAASASSAASRSTAASASSAASRSNSASATSAASRSNAASASSAASRSNVPSRSIAPSPSQSNPASASGSSAPSKSRAPSASSAASRSTAASSAASSKPSTSLSSTNSRTCQPSRSERPSRSRRPSSSPVEDQRRI